MNPFFFCYWQQFAIGFLAACASRHDGMGSEEWWGRICSSNLKKKKIIRKYLGVFFVCLVGFGRLVFLSWKKANSSCTF